MQLFWFEMNLLWIIATIVTVDMWLEIRLLNKILVTCLSICNLPISMPISMSHIACVIIVASKMLKILTCTLLQIFSNANSIQAWGVNIFIRLHDSNWRHCVQISKILMNKAAQKYIIYKNTHIELMDNIKLLVWY